MQGLPHYAYHPNTENPMKLNQYCSGICLAWLCCVQGAVAQVSTGTGFSVASGFLITNHHVIDGCASVEIKSESGRHRSAVVDADPLIDLALIRVPTLVGPSAKMRSSGGVELGEPVMVFGFPLAGALTSGGNFTAGLVSGLRGLRESAGEFQITAPVQPGNSGGPVLDSSGQVIGVVVAKLDTVRAAVATGDIPQNINFAVTSEMLNAFLNKNKIDVEYSSVNKSLNTASIAKLAKSFTHQIECFGKLQLTKESKTVPENNLLSPLRLFKDCPECPKMIVIPAGQFQMGSSQVEWDSLKLPKEWKDTAQPQHLVQIKNFAIGETEITQEEWYSIMGNNPSETKKRGLPVDNVSWNDAQIFVKKLSKKTNKKYRLPSEAEWEYAARGGSTTIYPWGNNEADSKVHAWYRENSTLPGNLVGSTKTVSLKMPNRFDLFDMIGNAREWTEDCWNINYLGAPEDGSAWLSGDCSGRVLRGGDWNSSTYELRSAFRQAAKVEHSSFFIGFRVVRDLP
jgi:formylglycine-generating enzyme required for sulfatase activity